MSTHNVGFTAGAQTTISAGGSEVYLTEATGPVRVIIPDLGEDFVLSPRMGRRFKGKSFTFVRLVSDTTQDAEVDIGESDIIDNRSDQVISDILPVSSIQGGTATSAAPLEVITMPANTQRRWVRIRALMTNTGQVGIGESGGSVGEILHAGDWIVIPTTAAIDATFQNAGDSVVIMEGIA